MPTLFELLSSEVGPKRKPRPKWAGEGASEPAPFMAEPAEREMTATVPPGGMVQAGTFSYDDSFYDDLPNESAVIGEAPAGKILATVGPNLATALGADKRAVVWATKDQAVQATIPAKLIAETVADSAEWWSGHGKGRSMGSYGGERRRLFGGLFRGRLRGGRAGG